ncbi:MAG: hypothetical protein K0B14_17635 [Anaerolineaceae bacterium]|nr:hypothetical protein [Anaerolineaceae bacterium]
MDYFSLCDPDVKEKYDYIQKVIINNDPTINKYDLIAWVTKLLLKFYEIPQNRVLIFSVTKNEACSIHNSLLQKGIYSRHPNSLTIYKFVRNLLNRKIDIISDEHFNTNVTNDVLGKVESIIFEKIEEAKLDFPFNLISKREYSDSELIWRYEKRRELGKRRITLDGIEVKSKAEKFIGDFLVEHGINYEYEKMFDWDGEAYHPDFYFNYQDKHVIIEHWATGTQNIKYWGLETPRDEYSSEKLRKKKYWEEKGEKFIFVETDADDLLGSRYDFEKSLYYRLNEKKIYTKRDSKIEIAKRVNSKTGNIIINLFFDFIISMKKMGLSQRNIQDRFKQIGYLPTYQNKFLNSLIDIYCNFEESKADHEYNFDELFSEAIHFLKNHQNGPIIVFPKNPELSFSLDDISLLILNKFTDFPPVFYNFIEALKQNNPDLLVVCDSKKV